MERESKAVGTKTGRIERRIEGTKGRRTGEREGGRKEGRMGERAREEGREGGRKEGKDGPLLWWVMPVSLNDHMAVGASQALAWLIYLIWEPTQWQQFILA